MLFATVNGTDAGQVFHSSAKTKQRFRLKGKAVSTTPSVSVEVIVNGEINRTLTPAPQRTAAGAYEHRFDETIELDASGWLAVRAWEERDQGRFRFAHTSPWHVEVEGKPLRPRREEVEFLVQRVKGEIARSSALLPAGAVEEFQKSLAIYEALAPTAR